MHGIDASRAFLAQVWIDETRCSRLLDCLDNFRKEWDDKLGVFRIGHMFGLAVRDKGSERTATIQMTA